MTTQQQLKKANADLRKAEKELKAAIKKRNDLDRLIYTLECKLEKK